MSMHDRAPRVPRVLHVEVWVCAAGKATQDIQGMAQEVTRPLDARLRESWNIV
jgi:hypothetical protein